LLDKRIAGRDWDWEIEVPKEALSGPGCIFIPDHPGPNKEGIWCCIFWRGLVAGTYATRPFGKL